jgi:GNAT superfamily N-acetyltransferase
MKQNTRNEFPIRRGRLEDIPILVAHHSLMFKEIMMLKFEPFNAVQWEEMEKSYTQKLQIELPSGICRAWVIEDNCNIVASGAVSVTTNVPVPADSSYHVAYIHSIYTDKAYRKMGLARRIVETAIHYCNLQGINRLLLNASDAGRPIYEAIGFRPVDNAMRLWIA